MSPSDLPELDRMCARFPDTPVIIDHFCLVGRQGRFSDEETAALIRMSKHKRVMLKLGGFYALGLKQPPYLDMLPLVRKLVSAFGPNRCMWESDAPMQAKAPHAYRAAVAVIQDHAGFLSTSDKHRIMAKTAEDFFFRR
jgi:predicted TIM-barrel fold metal-dependent hydrolase